MTAAMIDGGGVTSPRGYRAAGLHCGIKANGKPDLSLVVSDVPATAAGVFTLNLAKAAPVLVSQAEPDHVRRQGACHPVEQWVRQRLHRPPGTG